MTKELLQKILFIDIETVTAEEKYETLDADWKKLWDDQFFRDDEVTAKTPAERYALKGSLRAEFSKIVCLSIGAVVFKDNEPHLYVKSLTGNEKDILTAFSAAAAKYDTLCAHNGKNFDYPFITRRLIANGMTIPKIIDFRGKKPWEVTALDTQEMWQFGDRAFPSLDLLAKILEIPLKDELDGSKVHETYYVKKDIAALAKYCGLDVVRCARVFVKLNSPTLDIPNYTLAEGIMSNIDASFIDDIFGIPRDGSNIGDDENEVYTEPADQKVAVSFEEKVSGLGSEIKAVIGGDSGGKSAQEKPPEKKVSVSDNQKKEEAEKAAKQAIPADPTSNNSMFGDIFASEDVKAPVKVEPKAEAPKVEPKPEAKNDEEPPQVVSPAPTSPKTSSPLATEAVEPKAEVKTEPAKVETSDDLGTMAHSPPSQPSAPLTIAGKPTKHKWRLDAPSPKYNRFYAEKREALTDALLKGGELPFDQYFEELENASVDVTVGETFQAELVCRKMSDCQKHRERIKQVQLRVNRQFFQWERHMDLFGGLLARIEDVRGVEKRDGIRYEHMYDMESYYGDLKSLHKSIDNVMRVLDAAFECLSRQVTITMPMKEVADRFSTGPKPLTPTLQRFDGLKTQANSSSASISGTNSKEAGTTAEPKAAKSAWDL